MNSKKKIFINGRFLLQAPTGVNRFAYEICRALCKQNIEFTLICPNKKFNKEYDTQYFNIQRYGQGSSHFWEQIILPIFFFGKNNYHLLNFTGLGPIFILNKIITIHDLAFLYNPSWYTFTYRIFYKFMTPLCAKTAKKIITVSNFSKTEIIRFLKIKEDKIEVVYNAVPSIFYKNTSNSNNIFEKYILAVSSLDPRKNFETLLKSFKLLDDLPYKLLIIGTNNNIYNYNKTTDNDSKVIWLGRVSDKELINYYQHAECFIYPSLYEGFGIPPLEAMVLGCPVIASDIEVFHEIYGQSVIYVNPLCEDDISNKIRYLLANNSIKNNLMQLGIEQAKLYSWENSASKIMTIL